MNSNTITGDNVQAYGDPILASIEKLVGWLQGSYEGWDPYDGINNEKFTNIKLGRPYFQMGMIQFHRLSPLNTREFFGIRKGVSTKCLALFTQGNVLLYKSTGKMKYLEEAIRLSRLILSNSLENKYGNHAWASHYFTFVSFDDSALTPDAYDIIGTCNVLKGLSMLHQVTGDQGLLDVIRSCQTFLLQVVEHKDDVFYFQYAPKYDRKIVPNASAQALDAISTSMKSHLDDKLHALCDNVLRSLLDMQKQDGSWAYSIYHGGKEYHQLDFHQGCVIDGLLAYRDYSPSELQSRLEDAIAKASVCYEKQFLDCGRGLYRVPRKFPADIHNQAQGVITFSHLGDRFKRGHYADRAERVANWTISNMQDTSGYFYYQKGRYFVNKIPYMRWGQAWMFLALATLQERKKSFV